MNRYLLGIFISLGWTVLGCLLLAFGGIVTPGAKNIVVIAAMATGIPIAIYWMVLLTQKMGFGRFTILLGLLCGTPVGLAVGFAAKSVQSAGRNSILHDAGLDAHRADYLAGPIGEVAEPAEKLPAKCVIMDLDEHEFSELHFRLPKELMPASADEVKSIVQIHYRQEVVGTYTGGGDATRWHMDVTVIDSKSKQCIYKDHFLGSKPPESTKSYGGASGSKPSDELIDMLQRMCKA